MTRFDNTEQLGRHYRRLDTLAKLLTGDSVCAAVTIDKNNDSLLISTNSLTQNNANLLNNYFEQNINPVGLSRNSRDGKLGTTLKTLSKCAQEKHLTTENREDLFKLILKYTVNRYIHSNSVSQLEGSTSVIKDDKLKQLLQGYIAGFRDQNIKYDNYQEMLSNQAQICNHVQSSYAKSDWGPQLFDRCAKQDIIKKFFKTINNINKNLKKICEILYNKQFKEIQNIIKGEKFILVGSSIESKEASAHAEMNLMQYLIDNKRDGLWYFGISKLTCYGCTNDILIVNNTIMKFGNELCNLKIITRGAHNVDYSGRRIEPDLKIKNINELREHFKELKSWNGNSFPDRLY